MTESDMDAPFWEHVTELRKTLIRSLIAIIGGVAICLWFYQQIFSILTWPLHQSRALTSQTKILERQEIKRERIFNLGSAPVVHVILPDAGHASYLSPGTSQIDETHYLIAPGGYVDMDSVIPNNGLVVFGPIDGMSITLKVCFWLGLVLSSPVWLYFILKFVAPALREQEWSLVMPFIGLSVLFLSTGILFAYYATIPIANQYLQLFNASIGINLWSLSHYLDFSLFLILANALAFELSLVLFFLVHLGIFSADALASKRRHMIVLAFILGALLTPPDVLTQLMLAIPLIGLYEVTILYARIRSHASIRSHARG